jgi:hypothetical protein
MQLWCTIKQIHKHTFTNIFVIYNYCPNIFVSLSIHHTITNLSSVLVCALTCIIISTSSFIVLSVFLYYPIWGQINASPCYLPDSSSNRWLIQHKSQHNQQRNKVMSANSWALSSKFKTSHCTKICLLYLDKLQTWAEWCWCFLVFFQIEWGKCKINSHCWDLKNKA